MSVRVTVGFGGIGKAVLLYIEDGHWDRSVSTGWQLCTDVGISCFSV